MPHPRSSRLQHTKFKARQATAPRVSQQHEEHQGRGGIPRRSNSTRGGGGPPFRGHSRICRCHGRCHGYIHGCTMAMRPLHVLHGHGSIHVVAYEQLRLFCLELSVMLEHVGVRLAADGEHVERIFSLLWAHFGSCWDPPSLHLVPPTPLPQLAYQFVSWSHRHVYAAGEDGVWGRCQDGPPEISD